MYPYKVISKKGTKLSSGAIRSNSSATIPVSSSEEYNPRTQLALMFEVLVQNRAKVLDKIEGDLDDSSKPMNSEFPSVIRVLKENQLLHFFLKDFQAAVVDEFEELMNQIDNHTANPSGSHGRVGTQSEANDDWANQSEIHESSASVTSTDNLSDKEYEAIDIIKRNQQFLGIGRAEPQDKRLISERREIRKLKQKQNELNRIMRWVEDSSDETTTIFDFEFVLLTNYKMYSPSDRMIKSLAPKPLEIPPKTPTKIKEFSSPKQESEKEIDPQPGRKDSETSQPSRPGQRLDFCYYEYRIERLPVVEEQPENTNLETRKSSWPGSSHKTSRDDHHEVEVSTRSEEFVEEFVEAPEKVQEPEPVEAVENKVLSKAAKKKLKKLQKKDEVANVIANTEDPPLTPEKSPPQTPEVKSAKGKKKKPIVQATVKPIEPLFIDICCYDFEPLREKLRQKEIEKLKQESKDYLKDQLLKIPTVENLDEFEKGCINEINSIESLTKKMKQKARRKLRQEIDNEKINRNEKITQQNPDDFEDDYEDDSKKLLDFFLNNGKYMNLTEKDLTRMCLENPAHILMNHLKATGLSLNSLCGRKYSSTLIKEPKTAEGKGKRKDSGTMRFKEKIQGTIEKLDIELGHYEEKIEQVEAVYSLFQQYKDSSLKPVLNILHEDYHAVKENFNITRSNKVELTYFRKPGSSSSFQMTPS
jgi:hypothetical protein